MAAKTFVIVKVLDKNTNPAGEWREISRIDAATGGAESLVASYRRCGYETKIVPARTRRTK